LARLVPAGSLVQVNAERPYPSSPPEVDAIYRWDVCNDHIARGD
jgi:hypothetical protein